MRTNVRQGSAGGVCRCVCGWEGGKSQLVSECPLESPPAEREWPVVVRHLPLLKMRPHFETNKTLEKSKHVVPSHNWTQNQYTVLVTASPNLTDKPNWQKNTVTWHLKGEMAEPDEAPMLSNSLVNMLLQWQIHTQQQKNCWKRSFLCSPCQGYIMWTKRKTQQSVVSEQP